jgi:hypothetical protein
MAIRPKESWTGAARKHARHRHRNERRCLSSIFGWLLPESRGLHLVISNPAVNRLNQWHIVTTQIHDCVEFSKENENNFQ